MTILDEIIEFKRKEIVSCKELYSIEELQRQPLFEQEAFSLKEWVLEPTKTGIIAEFKRKSPSKGIINDEALVKDVTTAYSLHGASGLSVLTDFNFFGGSIDDLIEARENNKTPLLRKEFIIDDFQVIEAKAFGADAILLIAAVLDEKQIEQLYITANKVGVEVLLEIHDEEELKRINGHADLVGINNRNLKTFEVNLDNSIQLAQQLPNEIPKIAESGIDSPDTISELRKKGFDGFLIGENFMKTSNPGIAFKEFVSKL